MTDLRSARWFGGDDEVALLHRVAVAASEYAPGRPVIGIAVTGSDLNPCHGDADRLADAVAEGVRRRGATPMLFPATSLGEDLMKPSAMMYRNLLAIEVEEMVRAYPLDGLVVLAGCDKSVPAALMGMASANVPSLVCLVGARRSGDFDGRRLAAGTDVWRELDRRRSGEASDAEWAQFETCLGRVGPGICNVMGTAVSMGLIAEMLGMALPGSASAVAGGDDILASAVATGERVVDLVEEQLRPRDRMTPAAFANAARVLAAVGGSTNAVIHLLAVAGRLAVPFDLDRLDAEVRDVPLLTDVEPCGRGLIEDFHASGASPALVAALGDLVDRDVLCADGRSWGTVADAAGVRGPAIAGREHPFGPAPTLAVIRGTLAPDGAVIKVAAASAALSHHRGPAVVFSDYEDMRRRLDSPDLEIGPDAVLVVRGCGPVGAPGMPEWGMAPIPRALAERGVRDMLRITDGRMSGTSFGTVVLHITPESAVGGPLALVEDGDLIEFDLATRRLDLLVPPEEVERRAAAWAPAESAHVRGWPAMYRKHVLPASQGCDLDFLTAPTGGSTQFVEPVVGRS
ncbi:MAG: dihydroxy-acid dehydratase [Microthrixaceae bacterium]|nr:dihydroxy-acid dehydratase [Microthrixaceae bacterium]